MRSSIALVFALLLGLSAGLPSSDARADANLNGVAHANCSASITEFCPDLVLDDIIVGADASDIPVVPLPPSILLLGTALCCFFIVARRRKRFSEQ